MNYIELTIETTEQGAETVSARLDMLGISQVSITLGENEARSIMQDSEKYWDYADDAALNQQPAVKAYIYDNGNGGDAAAAAEAVRVSMRGLKAAEKDLGLNLGSLEVKTRFVAEEDWANNWKAFFKPQPVGEKLLICPSWEEPHNADNRLVLRIDPGMAFGTGSHHTTQMCLELLEKYMRDGAVIADLGCGSGILSIAGILLGAQTAYAVDIDPSAAKTAVENARLNGIKLNKYSVRTGDILTDEAFRAELTARKYDIALANIVADVLIGFAPVVRELLKDDGIFIASGIIDDRLSDVVSAFEENGLEIAAVLTGGDWCAAAVKKMVKV